MRPRQEIEVAQVRVQDELAETIALGIRGEEYARGMLAALAWVLGQGPAPMTGQNEVDVSNPYALDHRERMLATDMLYGRAELDRRGRSYVVGVEHSLMWVRHQNASPF